ncbi:MAG TPA: pyridoxamine 5'-phosphate oxidase family protein [Methylocella sp.]|nr:pyridoxamine 5'-phosphate oxidase family protein [Methylocella sp.]
MDEQIRSNNDGLTLYFLCGRDSQKAANLARDDRVSLTIDHDTPQVMEITGLSMAAHAKAVLDPDEAARSYECCRRSIASRYISTALELNREL